MLGLDLSAVDSPATARYHREAVEQIIQSVEERVYCALLGPRLSGKTLLLQYIEKQPGGCSAGPACILIYWKFRPRPSRSFSAT
jgi:ABC-type phosphate/phosphonate transport system ATPase subunit